MPYDIVSLAQEQPEGERSFTSDTNNCGVGSASNHLCLNTLYPKTKPLFSVPPATAFIEEHPNHVTLDTNIICEFK